METNINWYPGHMVKTKRLIKEKLGLIDIVFEVVDARIPASSKVKDINDFVKKKPRILIMTKIDLCDMKETNKWVKYYEEQGYHVIKMDLINKWDISIIINKTKEILKDLDVKREAKGLIKKKYRALAVGVPNVGKSTLINRLAGRKAVNVGNKPGVTKGLSWVKINTELELLDSPGILWPKFNDRSQALNLGSMTSIKEEVLPIDEIAVHILDVMFKYYPENLKERYGVEEFDYEDLIPTYEQIGKRRGCLIKGGEVDYDKVSLIIVNDMKEGRLGKITFDRVK